VVTLKTLLKSPLPMIAVRNVSKIHHRGRVEIPALREVSCDVAPGSWTFILGPSGSGKTTLMHLIGALDAPTTGEIEIAGRNLGNMTTRERDIFRRHDVGFVFQNFNLLSNLTAVENVLVPFYPEGIQAAHRRSAVELLGRLGLSKRVDHRPVELSGGEQQRVAIARALLKKPKLILADEPTGELDSANSAAILADLRELSHDQGTTVIIVTHEHELVQPGDQVIKLRDGRVVEF
jgi:putative ABC transport system ATP-binding protein